MQPETAVERREGLHSTREQEIRIRSYEIYLQRGELYLALNWKIGYRLNVSSLRNNRIRFGVRIVCTSRAIRKLNHGDLGQP